MSRRSYDWPRVIAHLQRTPGQWAPLFPDHPLRLATRITLRQHPALRRPDGRIEALVRNQYTPEGSAPRADIWVRWVNAPDATKEDAQ